MLNRLLFLFDDYTYKFNLILLDYANKKERISKYQTILEVKRNGLK